MKILVGHRTILQKYNWIQLFFTEIQVCINNIVNKVIPVTRASAKNSCNFFK